MIRDRLKDLVANVQLRASASDFARRTWMKYAMRGVRQADAFDRLDMAYKVSDPWRMETPRERFRFARTNRLVQEHLGPEFEKILEIGSGEGHQTEHLVELASPSGEVTGLEVSATAVERANARLAGKDGTRTRFVAGDLFAQPWSNERGRFDLVTACEVLYYMSDIPRTLRTMDELGGACIVTYFEPASRICEAPAMAMPGAQKASFAFDDTEWIAVWWRGASRRA
jgi:SAM-dependent methyltransferase